MNLELDGKRALVTGSTAGIGYAIAHALAREGAHVIVNGRTTKRVEQALQSIRTSDPQADVEGFAADLGGAEGSHAVAQRFPEIDILVNNLAMFAPKPFEQIADEDWFRIFDVNVMSGVRLCRAYLSGMKKRNWGRIVFISSESAVQIPAEMIDYGMTKTAQLAVSRGLAETTAGTGVTVNAVLPGPTASEGLNQFVDRMAAGASKTRAEMEQDFFRNVRPSSLLQRFARPDEVAALVVFLCSPLSSATNGAALRADGGVVRSIL